MLYLRVTDIAAAHETLKQRGVRFTHAPHMIHRHADGTEEWMAFFEDPDGRPLAIMSQIVPGGKRENLTRRVANRLPRFPGGTLAVTYFRGFSAFAHACEVRHGSGHKPRRNLCRASRQAPATPRESVDEQSQLHE